MASTEITIPIPAPVIIRAAMRISDWKNCFIEKKRKTVIPTEQSAYEKCFKALMWAEFCNGTLVKAGNSKGAINFIFEFPNKNCRLLFERHLDDHLEVVTLI